MYCNVLVTKPFDHTFTYKIGHGQNLKVGNVVSVPFGKKKGSFCKKGKVLLKTGKVPFCQKERFFLDTGKVPSKSQMNEEPFLF